jgi:hypothetical protein
MYTYKSGHEHVKILTEGSNQHELHLKIDPAMHASLQKLRWFAVK